MHCILSALILSPRWEHSSEGFSQLFSQKARALRHDFLHDSCHAADPHLDAIAAAPDRGRGSPPRAPATDSAVVDVDNIQTAINVKNVFIDVAAHRHVSLRSEGFLLEHVRLKHLFSIALNKTWILLDPKMCCKLTETSVKGLYYICVCACAQRASLWMACFDRRLSSKHLCFEMAKESCHLSQHFRLFLMLPTHLDRDSAGSSCSRRGQQLDYFSLSCFPFIYIGGPEAMREV